MVPPIEPDIGARIGAAIESTARGYGWSQRELARRLGTNQSAIRRLVRGVTTLNTELATSALDTLGIRMILDADPVGLSGRAEQRDLVHARCCDYVMRRLRRRGWEVRAEVEIGEGRFRGWIDILAFRPADGSLLVIEIKTELDDLGRILRGLGWYIRSSRDTARALGWAVRRIVPALMVLATVEADVRLASSAAVWRTTFTGQAEALASWIDGPSASGAEPVVALIDPLNRRGAWLWRPRAAGGRRSAPYADYRAAAASLKTPM